MLVSRSSDCTQSLFFFSTKRRHTTNWRYWSSDVWSSEPLDGQLLKVGQRRVAGAEVVHRQPDAHPVQLGEGIGRASCRERVRIWWAAVKLLRHYNFAHSTVRAVKRYTTTTSPVRTA